MKGMKKRSHMRKIICVLAIIVFVGALAPVVFAKNQQAQEAQQVWPSQIRPSYRAGDGRSVFSVDYLLPIVNGKKYLIFADPRIMADSKNNEEFNFGLGYRRLVFDEKLILGGNAYFDERFSHSHNKYSQFGLGAEALSKWVDARVNAYLPTSKRQVTDQTWKFGSTGLLQYDSYEEPLRGVDGELGVMVPFISDYIETRVYGGGYYYHSKYDKDVTGEKARIEIRPMKCLTINLEWKHDNYKGNELYAGGYITIPFSLGDIFQRKNPFEGLKDNVKFAPGPRDLKERMTDMVVRDVDIVSKSYQKESKIQDLVYVNNANAKGVENGTLEYPWNTLAEGLADGKVPSAWLVVFAGDGTATGYTGNYALPAKLTMWGQGYRLYGLLGGRFPLIDGGGGGNVLTLGNNNRVMGLQVQNGNRGINAVDKTGITIERNIVTGNTSDGIRVRYTSAGVYDCIIKSNTVDTNQDGITVTNVGTGTVNYTVLDNFVNANTRNGIIIKNENIGTTAGAISGNTSTGNPKYGIVLQSDNGGTLTSTITNNIVSSATNDGVYVHTQNGSSMNVTFSYNNISGCAQNGVYINTLHAGSNVNVSLYRNTIANNLTNGVRARDDGAANTTVVDLGGGSLGSIGYNSIYGNANRAVRNNLAGVTIMAENNWWGVTPPNPADFAGLVDYTPWLTSDPN